MQVDLNCDMGESWGAYTLGNDAAMLDIVSSANIACGFHAGDPMVIHDTLTLAQAKRVSPGAHPGFMDLPGFGRRPIQGERPADIERQVLYQIGAVAAMARAVGTPISHVKAHGALSNMAAVDRSLADAIVAAVKAFDAALCFVTLPRSEMERAALAAGLPVISEVFADRAYDDDGLLVSRKLPGAVLHDPEQAAERVVRMVEDGAVTSVSGKRVSVPIDTICVHGDNPAAVAMARRIRERLTEAGITISPFADHPE